MHNGMLRFTGEKMSKSLGNAATIREVLDTGAARPSLLFFLTGHWRKPIDFSDETMTAAARRPRRFRNALRGETRSSGDWAPSSQRSRTTSTRPRRSRSCTTGRVPAPSELRRGLDVFGLGGLADRRRRRPRSSTLAEARVEARASRDFAEADRLRDEIATHGWDVRDVAAGYELVPRA